uniref:HVA22-like protein n=2 Tax=Cannabis sativa TaxID=3483 RepID=A0A803R383_CANSA
MMGFSGFLQILLTYFLHDLAWPLLAFVYPSYCSVKAIEINTLQDAQKLNAYWIVLSLILLIEHALGTLLQRLPFWTYIRLVVVCWLVIPHFDAAFYVYKHLLHPCFSIINCSNQEKKNQGETGTTNARENGYELVLDNIASKSNSINFDVAVVKDINSKDVVKEEVTSANQPSSDSTKNPEVKEIKPVSVEDDKLVKQSSSDGPNLTKKDVSDVKLTEKKEVKEPVQASRVEPKPAEVTEKRTIITTEAKQTVPEIPSARAQLSLPLLPKSFQKEWKCPLCKVKVQSEITFFSHLQGRKHKDMEMEEATKAKKSQPKIVIPKKSNQSTEGEPRNLAKNQMDTPKVVISYAQKQSNEVGKQALLTNDWEPIIVRHDMSKGILKTNNIAVSSSSVKTAIAPVAKPKVYHPYCHVCNVSCSGKIDMDSHLKGRRHLSQLQLLGTK